MTIDKVKKLVATQLNKPVDKIQDNSRLIEDLGADSLDILDMLMALESEFGISIPDEDTPRMTTIKGVAEVIDEKLKK